VNGPIDFHPLIRDGDETPEVVDSLRLNRIAPKLLYTTLWQVELWRKVFQRHSPIHRNPEFARIYRNAFEHAARELSDPRLSLVGLGCGTGLKEAELCSQLKAHNRAAAFTAVDVSRNLVEESMQRVEAAGAAPVRGLVCDLAETDFLSHWLENSDSQLRRLFTFFGLVPNLAPSIVSRIFRTILRPGDLVLVSAHLAPVDDAMDLPSAMKRVFSQYDNAETLAWHAAALKVWGLEDLVEAPKMRIGDVEGAPAFISESRWKSDQAFELMGASIAPKTDEPLRIFHSMRYTPALFEKRLRDEGFAVERLAMTACREEAIWAVKRA
jgi:L-histidine N-alpha-methyltransferase